MFKFIFGVLVGIAATTIGFSGMAMMADKGVVEVQKVLKDSAK